MTTADFHTCFLGAIKAGIVPVPVNTRLTRDEYAFMLHDARAQAAFVSASLAPAFEGLHDRVILDGGALARLIAPESPVFEAADTVEDEMCFWLYTSGTTGQPKAAVHLQGDMARTAELYAGPTLSVSEDDVLFSAAKLFFAYGLGNGLTSPMAAGAAAVLLEGPPEPASVCRLLREARPTIFFGVPTLFAMLLASGEAPGAGRTRAAALRLRRRGIAAGNPAPLAEGRRRRHPGRPRLHRDAAYLHHQPRRRHRARRIGGARWKAMRSGWSMTTTGLSRRRGALGVLEVRGPTSAGVLLEPAGALDRDLQGARGPRTGDKYTRDQNGVYAFAGRADDMLKVGGIYVSPFEVEGALLKHEAVLEVGRGRRKGPGRPRQAQGLRGPAGGQGGRRGGTPGFRARPCSQPTNIRAGSNSWANCPKRRPARSSATSSAQ